MKLAADWMSYSGIDMRGRHEILQLHITIPLFILHLSFYILCLFFHTFYTYSFMPFIQQDTLFQSFTQNSNHSVERVIMSRVTKDTKRRIYSLQYLQCQNREHQGQDLSMVCLKSQCFQKRLICVNCEQKQHKGHLTLPLKQYIMHIQNERSNHPACQQRDNYSKWNHQEYNNSESPTSKTYGSTSSFPISQERTNYLSYLQLIQAQKLSAMKQLHRIKQKFISQILIVQTELQVMAMRYTQKVMEMAETFYSQHDLIERVRKLTDDINQERLNKMINRYVQNYDFPKVENGQIRQMDQKIQDQNHTKRNHQEKFVFLYSVFHRKIQNFGKMLASFDLNFIPNLSANIIYKEIKFIKQIGLFQWDILLKAKTFQIDEQNPKIIRVKVMSTTAQRFALMNKGFPYNTKQKHIWAIRINRLDGWVGIGVALKKVISQAQLKFNYTKAGHGSYLISSNKLCWSHFSALQNSKITQFALCAGDTIILIYDPVQQQLTFKKYLSHNKSISHQYVLKIAPYQKGQLLCPCVNMCSIYDQVQIVTVPEGVW